MAKFVKLQTDKTVQAQAKPRLEKLDSAEKILARVKEVFDQHPSYNATKSKIVSCVLSYFHADLTDDVISFKKIMKGIYNLLLSRSDVDQKIGNELYLKALNDLTDYTKTLEYERQTEVLGDIQHALEHGNSFGQDW